MAITGRRQQNIWGFQEDLFTGNWKSWGWIPNRLIALYNHIWYNRIVQESILLSGSSIFVLFQNRQVRLAEIHRTELQDKFCTGKSEYGIEGALAFCYTESVNQCLFLYRSFPEKEEPWERSKRKAAE